MKDLIKGYYEDIAKQYDSQFTLKNKPYYSLESKIIKSYINSQSSVLDLGCGTARYSKFFKDYLGVDISRSMCKVAKMKERAREIINADITHLNLKKKFDAILCLQGVINMIPRTDREKLLDVIYEHLKDNGVGIVSGWNFLNSLSRIQYISNFILSSIRLRSLKIEVDQRDKFTTRNKLIIEPIFPPLLVLKAKKKFKNVHLFYIDRKKGEFTRNPIRGGTFFLILKKHGCDDTLEDLL